MSLRGMKGNKYIELLSTTNKQLMDQWKMHSSVQKEYDVISKTYVYNVGGKSPSDQICLPKDKKNKLGLYYPLLVLQLYFPIKANILCNIGVMSCSSQRKRITLSSNQKSKQNSLLFAIVPFAIENSNKWINVLVDVEQILSTVWNGLNFKGIDFLSLSGVFRLKRIFLLSRDLIQCKEGIFVISYDQLPKQMSQPKNMIGHYLYISSSHCSQAEYSNDINSDVSDRNSSKNSSSSTLNAGRFPIRRVRCNENKYAESLSGKSVNSKKQFQENSDLNLSMRTFSEEMSSRSEDLNSDDVSDTINTELDTCARNFGKCIINTAERDIELWMPLSSSNKTSVNSNN